MIIPKISVFHSKNINFSLSIYFEKILRENQRDIIILMFMMSLAKKPRNWCQKCNIMLVISEYLLNGFMY